MQENTKNRPTNPKKLLRRSLAVLKAFCFAALFILGLKFLRFILTDDAGSLTRIMMHELYSQEENIDVLFLGSSHCYRSLIPYEADRLMNKNTFNAGSSSQSLDISYELLKEASKKNRIKEVYLELYYDISSVVYKKRTSMTSTYIITDYMKPSLDKFIFLLGASSSEHYPNSFIVAKRNYKNLFDKEYILKTVQKKIKPDYRSYVPPKEYAGKGYVENFSVSEDGSYCDTTSYYPIDTDNISDDWLRTLDDIVTFCDQRDIKLNLFSAPMPDFVLVSKGNYDEYISFVKNIASEYGLEYYDFNLCKREYMSMDPSLFMDDDHLNADGAEKFTRLFCDFYSGKTDSGDLFYESVEQRLESDKTAHMYGLSFKKETKDGRNMKKMRIVSRNDEDYEYSVDVCPEGGERYTLRDFSSDKYFYLPNNEKGFVYIKMKKKDAPASSAKEIKIKYS